MACHLRIPGEDVVVSAEAVRGVTGLEACMASTAVYAARDKSEREVAIDGRSKGVRGSEQEAIGKEG